MDRIFHVKIGFYMYLYLVIAMVALFVFLWMKIIVGIVLMGWLVVMTVERIIHSQYTITDDGNLVVDNGRFTSKIVVPLQTVTRIEDRHSMSIGGKSLINVLVIHYGYCKQVSVMPINKEEFIRKIEKFQNEEEDN